jgi:hypothetical protein
MSPFDSPHLHHLPWRSVELGRPGNGQIVIVRGTASMMAPKNEFVALAVYDDVGAWVVLDHFADQGFKVTHWCTL